MNPRRIILVINPGSTSTKVAWFQEKDKLWQEILTYSPAGLRNFKSAMDQYTLRRNDIRQLLDRRQADWSGLSAVAGRGGPFRPMESGTYRVSESLLEQIRQGRVLADHISNLGVVLAHEFAALAGVPAYFVDPVCVDEFEKPARYSGMPELERRSLLHALNIKAAARQTAGRLNRPLDAMNMIVAHLGGGISVCAMKKGRMIDVNNANEEGPFSPERCGTLPASSLARLCYSGEVEYSDMKRRIVGQGGLTAYLGTSDLREISRRIGEGDREAQTVLEAMAYQIAKEIGSMAAVLSGRVDAVVLTGGLSRLTAWIGERVRFIAPVTCLPGETEMEALAAGVLRVLNGEEEEKEIPDA